MKGHKEIQAGFMFTVLYCMQLPVKKQLWLKVWNAIPIERESPQQNTFHGMVSGC